MNTESKNTTGDLLTGPSPKGIRWLLANNDFIFALGLGVVLATLLIPLPTAILDILLSCSIAIALATIVVVLSVRESIEFSAFPSLLLFVTLFRLSLNVASTRLILLQADAGRIIETFGEFVVGGNMVIGLVIFLILVVIQFVVITKGSERISEVSARFHLDAMPGKQMAIDADLSSGLIGEDQARDRREKIVQESEFYGSMDGASKFIRGDAIAGLIITAVNLIGGLAVGMGKGMSLGEAGETYSILAVGDGLVTQIPALIISTASGFLISKASTKKSVGQDLTRQMLSRSRPLTIASFLMGAMVFVPGFPKVPFIVLALGTGLLARRLSRNEREALEKKTPKRQAEPDQTSVEELLDVDRLSIQVGSGLIKTVDPRQKNSLSHRIGPLRRRFAQEYGVILPLVRLRDNIMLKPNTYEIRLYNHVISSGSLEPDKYLAMDPGTVQKTIPGQPAEEPVFNLPALWIDSEQKEQAELQGYTVVDPESILVTHLAESLKRHAHELLSRDDVQGMVDRLSKKEPTLVSEVVGKLVSIGLLQRVLQNLLKDRIPIRDFRQIVEALGDSAEKSKDIRFLTEMARKALVRTITEQYIDTDGKIHTIVLDPALEHELCNAAGEAGKGTLALTPQRALGLAQQIANAWKSAMEGGHDKIVLLCESRLRADLADMLVRQVPQLPVLAYEEVSIGTGVESLTTISLNPQGEGAIDGAGAPNPVPTAMAAPALTG
ncbi:MAG TPA: flagellar biosynthesis protein FlhA [Phycisphaerae bacterium]|nr:flagellar biosynthesis protein FlhA [Phycisphaerae bacterium]